MVRKSEVPPARTASSNRGRFRMRSSRTVRSATHLVTTAALCSALALPALGGAAQARGAGIPSVHLGLFAAAPPGATHPDDITSLGDLLSVTYQNNAPPSRPPAAPPTPAV